MSAIKIEHSLNTAQRKQLVEEARELRTEIRRLRQVLENIADALFINPPLTPRSAAPGSDAVVVPENEANAKAD